MRLETAKMGAERDWINQEPFIKKLKKKDAAKEREEKKEIYGLRPAQVTKTVQVLFLWRGSCLGISTTTLVGMFFFLLSHEGPGVIARMAQIGPDTPPNISRTTGWSNID